MIPRRYRRRGGERAKGFTLLEVLFVGAILAILVALAMPAYLKYIHQARVVSLVLPGVHVVESEVMFHYLVNGELPDDQLLNDLAIVADTRYFRVARQGNGLRFTIHSPELTSKLHLLDGESMVAVPATVNGKIISWSLTGQLAERLGIEY